MSRLRSTIVVVMVAGAMAASGCSRLPAQSVVGDPVVGHVLVGRFACGSCHAIPGVEHAQGLVGPDLAGIGERSMIAGVLPNTPADMIAWLQSPQSVTPGNAMPDEGLTRVQAANIAAYLYTLRGR
ncbi:MAG TPA: c-type cytochrome [Caulobacteraceae bacterium]|jgi:cytochrome c2|nr:c-type cytochrome [Caulobacteraceae bacterium]